MKTSSKNSRRFLNTMATRYGKAVCDDYVARSKKHKGRIDVAESMRMLDASLAKHKGPIRSAPIRFGLRNIRVRFKISAA